MSRRDDAFWQDTLDRLDLDTGGLAEAERRLARETDEAAPLDPAWIDKVVAQATAPPTRVLTMPRPRVWTKLAAGLLGAMLLTALVWTFWDGTNSTFKLPLTEAVVLMRNQNADVSQRASALAVAFSNARHAIETLKEIRDRSSERVLAEAAEGHLKEMASILRGVANRCRVEAELTSALPEVMDPDLPLERRSDALGAAGRTAQALLRSLRDMQGMPTLEDEARHELLERLRQALPH